MHFCKRAFLKFNSDTLGIKRFSRFFEDDSMDLRENFFQGLGGNTSSLQPALKSIYFKKKIGGGGGGGGVRLHPQLLRHC